MGTDNTDGQTLPDGAFFTVEGDLIRPTDFSRGPWDPESCHAGPPTAMLARQLEHLVVEKQLVRLTVDLTSPVPVAGFRIEAKVERQGRSVTTTTAALVDLDGKTRARAKGLHLAQGSDNDFPTAPVETPDFDQSEPGEFPIKQMLHDLTGFRSATAVRYPAGESNDSGPGTVWMRTIPIVDGEEPSPFQRICPLADCGNAISRNGEATEYAFLNADLTIVLHRPPRGQWFGSRATSHWQPNGVGMSDALLFDEHGPVGRALQTLLIRPQNLNQ